MARDRVRRDPRRAVLAVRHGALGPDNAVDLWRALRAACVDPAVTAGEPDRGRLVAGQRADIVVLPAAAVDEPVEVGGALWNARPRLRAARRRGRVRRRVGRRTAGCPAADVSRRQRAPRWRRAS